MATFDGTTVLDFRILEGAFEVERNPAGVPLSRSINGLTIFKKDGVCTMIGSNIKQTNEGGAQYGAPQFLGDSDARLKRQTIPCALASSHSSEPDRQ